MRADDGFFLRVCRRDERLAARAQASSRNTHGLPSAPRPTITAAQPVCAYIRAAEAASVTSPLPTTGMPTARTTSAMPSRSAFPAYICARVRPWTVRKAAPARSAASAQRGRVAGSAVHAQPHFHTDGDAGRFDDGADERGGLRDVAHQRAALAVGENLMHGAAHIDIDIQRAVNGDPLGGLRHHVRLGAEKLDACGAFVVRRKASSADFRSP